MPARDHAREFANARSRLLVAMSDLAWHTRQELEAIAGNRYGARLRELKRLGYVFEDRELGERDGKDYRLASAAPASPRGKRVRVYLEEADAADLLGGRISMFARAEVQGALASYRANKGRL